MNKERLQMSIQTVRDNIKILESQEAEDAGYYLQLEHEKMVLNVLKKQMPKKCKLFKDLCDCGKTVYPHMDYCDKCGQALEWHKDTTEKGGAE